ncbi:hypothetical protein [Nannocystis radixulma]|uniref:Uncharacterized protein n=1 Tax=Nannocystis radixulma TaxID=2995305 RepID=A0ABT5B737_9BACT|nr:hypothetical protein [Nannocystis radixulma]MDC0668902.1 hypothetical protein [Nannocystis radixulma]
MTEQASFELGRGGSLSAAAVGKTIIHRPTRDAGFPLVFGAICGALALGLVVAAVVTAGAVPATLLIVLELLIAAGLGWMATWLLPDALAAQRFNRRAYEVRFELRHIEIRSRDGLEQVTLADAPAHPFLRSLAIDSRIHPLLRVRAACEQLSPRADIRVILETLALLHLDGESIDAPVPPPPRPYYATIVGDAAMFFRDPEKLAHLRRTGTPVYRIDTEWDPAARTQAPRLTPASVRRM